ncbi:anti-anti-sigma regulatory factor [Hamadaea flava]|uniref:MEDS domain-containing protein n=1 Tax=Hamadaea flava TaxID=1742688 RepID=A0ABV8LQ57_9ACTN|nr:MEDS domain-containing protein [Hamadaea flava]MCP2322944.1 anti-anti-sigma regulatory factor [Hamadaea flava]
MRRTGVIGEVDSVGAHDHVCFVYTERAEWRAAARSFAVSGLAAEQRVLMVADPGEDCWWEADDVLGAALRSGRAELLHRKTAYADDLADPSDQVDVYRDATDRAIRDGFRGLRAFADATGLAGPPPAMDRLIRYEHLVDGYMDGHPFRGMCGYDRAAIAPADLRRLACRHPSSSPGYAPFRVYAESGGLRLAGDIDYDNVELLTEVLRSMGLPATGSAVELDGAGLDYVHHAGLVALARLAQESGGRIVLRGGPAVAKRLADMLSLNDAGLEVIV